MTRTFELDRVPLFRELPAEHLAALEGAAVRQLFEAGEVVFRQGDPPEYLYVVESGAVDVVVESAGEELVLATFDVDSFFGELAIFDDRPRNATARTTERTSLVCVPGSAVIALLERYPTAARKFIGAIAQRLRGTVELVSRLQIRNVNEVAEERMTMAERIADEVARFGGSWTFIIIFGVLLFAWMGLNTYRVLAHPPDPFPFIFLNLILSCVAAIQAPIIMMSQNRHSMKDRLQADMDYRVNIKAEIAVQQLHRKVDELRVMLLQQRTTAARRE